MAGVSWTDVALTWPRDLGPEDIGPGSTGGLAGVEMLVLERREAGGGSRGPDDLDCDEGRRTCADGCLLGVDAGKGRVPVLPRSRLGARLEGAVDEVEFADEGRPRLEERGFESEAEGLGGTLKDDGGPAVVRACCCGTWPSRISLTDGRRGLGLAELTSVSTATFSARAWLRFYQNR